MSPAPGRRRRLVDLLDRLERERQVTARAELPTDHLDDAIAVVERKLDRLKDVA